MSQLSYLFIFHVILLQNQVRVSYLISVVFSSTCPAAVGGVTVGMAILVCFEAPVLITRMMLGHTAGANTSVVVVPIEQGLFKLWSIIYVCRKQFFKTSISVHIMSGSCKSNNVRIYKILPRRAC